MVSLNGKHDGAAGSASELTQRIVDIAEDCGLDVATVVGCLETIKHSVIWAAIEEADDGDDCP